MLRPPYNPPSARPRVLVNWLYAVALLIVAMVVVGGITRLTESGLSITEWRPVTGILPPLSDAQWQVEFAKYRQIPEYQQINAGMSLAAFKGIFFWEYLHRLMGRIIGLAFALPLAWFWVRNRIPAGYKPRLVALLALGAVQGAIGWWMVVSGLSVRTDVSHVRLAVHLCTALVILGGVAWTALDLRTLARGPDARAARLTLIGGGALAILFVQLFWGALMAGLNAGLVARDWPMMNGTLYPGASRLGESMAVAVIDDPAIVHFIHRWWAWVAVGALLLLARAVKRAGDRGASIVLHALVGTQILVGIATVMLGVPIWIAAVHQLIGALLVVATVRGAHSVGRAA